MCPYGCWGNGLCTLPGVNVNALPASALIDGTNLLNTYGLTVDAVKAFSYVSGVTTVYPFVEMITKVLGVLSFEGSGTCVCDEAYSGANCEILEKDTFLYDMTYYNISTLFFHIDLLFSFVTTLFTNPYEFLFHSALFHTHRNY